MTFGYKKFRDEISLIIVFIGSIKSENSGTDYC